jgi:hypothetical protein
MSKPEKLDPDKKVNDAIQAFLDAAPDLEQLDRAVQESPPEISCLIQPHWEKEFEKQLNFGREYSERTDSSNAFRSYRGSMDAVMLNIFLRGIKQKEIVEVFFTHFEHTQCFYQDQGGYSSDRRTEILTIIAETLPDLAEKAISLMHKKGYYDKSERAYQYLRLVVIPEEKRRESKERVDRETSTYYPPGLQ